MRFGSPIFIGGYPKSGTTLIRALLDGHSRLLVYPRETSILRQIAWNSLPELEAMFEQGGAAYLNGLLNAPSGTWDFTSVDFERFETLVRQKSAELHRHPGGRLEAIIQAFGEITSVQETDYWVEKTPKNELHTKVLERIWPDTFLILMVRDPRDAFVSHREYRAKINNKKPLSLSKSIQLWRDGVLAWRAWMAKGRRGMLIRFEDLTANPQAVMTQLCSELNLPWEDVLLKPTVMGKLWRGNSSKDITFSQVTKLPQRFPGAMTPGELLFMEIHLAPLMRLHGYSLTNFAASLLYPFRRFLGMDRANALARHLG